MTDVVTAPTAVNRSWKQRANQHWQNALMWVVIAAVAATALLEGIKLRHYAWDQTEPIRYVADIDNAFIQGTEVLRQGYIERYDEQMTHPNADGFMQLDYAPGRLAIATLWTKWVREREDGPITDRSQIRDWNTDFYIRAIREKKQYELCRPLLMVNMTGEILSSIAMFLLVRRYTSGNRLRTLRGNVLGLIAALFFWFDPALIWNAHCWPQWDSWVLPFFLWAVLLASLDWWFCAGLLIATGAMFKGQILFGAGVFILWPIFQGRPLAVVRWIIGLLTATAAITAVWLVRAPGAITLGTHHARQYVPGHVNPAAVQWIIYLALIFLAILSNLTWSTRFRPRIPLGIAVAAVLSWTISTKAGNSFSVVGFLILAGSIAFFDFRLDDLPPVARVILGWLAVLVLIYPAVVLVKGWAMPTIAAAALVGIQITFAPRRAISYTAAAWMAIGMLLCQHLFQTTTAWFDRGFMLGTHHYEKMASEANNNLAELLQSQWGWDDLMEPVFKLPPSDFSHSLSGFLSSVDPGVKASQGDADARPFRPNRFLRPARPEVVNTETGEVGLPLKYALLTLWILTVVLCALGSAIHDRAKSPRFLASIAAPWITFFAVMTQMHQRYLLWGSSISAATSVLNPGYAVLHVFLSVVSMSQEMMSMMNNPISPRHRVHMTDNAAYQFFNHWHPGIAWAVLLTAVIFVYTSSRWDKPKS